MSLYTVCMKMYISGYDWSPEYQEAIDQGKPFPKQENLVVGFEREPQWKIETRHLPEVELRSLQQMNVRVGTHYCQLAIEQLEGESFAIACSNHPDPITQ